VVKDDTNITDNGQDEINTNDGTASSVADIVNSETIPAASSSISDASNVIGVESIVQSNNSNPLGNGIHAAPDSDDCTSVYQSATDDHITIETDIPPGNKSEDGFIEPTTSSAVLKSQQTDDEDGDEYDMVALLSKLSLKSSDNNMLSSISPITDKSLSQVIKTIWLFL